MLEKMYSVTFKYLNFIMILENSLHLADILNFIVQLFTNIFHFVFDIHDNFLKNVDQA